MYLITAATNFEMAPFKAATPSSDVETLITGVGPVETACRLTSFLYGSSSRFKGVINFGAGGAYIDPVTGSGADLLDICLAEKEVLGDLGICLGDRIERMDGKELEVMDTFIMDVELLERASSALRKNGILFHKGNFITVSCATGTEERGTMLAGKHDGLCENMEGAAIARVCLELNIPCLEIRCISNLVEDRDTKRWKLKQACKRSAETASIIVRHLLGKDHV